MSTETTKTAKEKNPLEIILKNVRISYPHIFVPKAAKGSDKLKYSASFLFPKNDPAAMKQVEEIKAIINKLLKDENEGKPIKAANLCLKDGDVEKPDDEGYAGCWYLSSSSDRPPDVRDRIKDAKGRWAVLTEKDKDRIVGGFYVNSVTRLWWQDNDFGKRVNASLEVVQFNREGARFGAEPTDADDVFTEDDLSPEDESDLV